MPEPPLNIDVADGKYTVGQDSEGRLFALRHNEHWRELTGDNLVLHLAYEVESLRSRLGLDTKTGQPKPNLP